jgi:DNA uptake protein ComE-like DNA-binding protein
MQGRAIGAAVIALVAIACTGASIAAESKLTAQPPAGHPPMAAKKTAPATPVKLVDINSANREQLKALPGIGDAEAARIIAGRPYLSKAELATKNVLPTGVYISIKNLIIAKQTGKTNLKK